MSPNDNQSKQVLLRIDGELYEQILGTLSETGDKTVQDFFRRAAASQLAAMRATSVSVLDAVETITGEVEKASQALERLDRAMKLLTSSIDPDSGLDPNDLMSEIADTFIPPAPSPSVYGACNFVLVNTNIRSDRRFDADMIRHHKAAAYFQPWQKLIQNNVHKGDWVFLYRSGVGIVAFGRAATEPEETRFDWDDQPGKNETFVKLDPFHDMADRPVDLKTIRAWSGYQLNPRRTVVTFEVNAGASLLTRLEWEIQHGDGKTP